ncbi:MAG TPA: non-homologous end-joining DNA ligase [Actinomycetota bacterium]|nr:non-homologous end-joining DNA ligase [Actinomycetota bacterium]
MHPILEGLDPSERRLLRRRAMPTFTPLMLATLAKQAFSDPAWVFEPKLDGQRSLLWKRRSTVRLITRNEKDRTSHYPDLVEAVRKEDGPALIADGEIVAFLGEVTSFSRLQERMQNSRPSAAQVAAVPVAFYLFDLIWFDGYDLSALPLLARKSALRQAILFQDPIRFSEHLEEEGELAFRAACEKGWEGLIAKRAAAPYTHARSRDWLKFKCVNEQEFVVVGWTDPHGARSGLGALLVGYYEDGELRFGGKVGTGFDARELTMLTSRLARLEQPASPVAETKGLTRKGVHWVRPELVAQVGFSEWTPDGKLRHPRYKGLRDDKRPEQVVRERAQGA